MFKRGDIVNTSSKLHAIGAIPKIGGIVKYVACYNATSGGRKTCDKKTCIHPVKDYVYVVWPPNVKTLFSYHHSYLELSAAQQTTDTNEFAEKAKEVIAVIQKAKDDGNLDTNKGSDVDWVRYNTHLPGNTRTRSPRTAREPIVIDKVEDIDWAKYNGFVRSNTYRKTKAE